jgi:hypothetical protein
MMMVCWHAAFGIHRAASRSNGMSHDAGKSRRKGHNGKDASPAIFDRIFNPLPSNSDSTVS